MAGDDGAGAEIGVLVGVEFYPQAVGRGLVEQAVHLGVAETHLVAEAVDLVDDALAHRLGQHLVAHEVDVVVAAAGIFGRETVGAEISRHHRDRQVAAQRARDAHQAKLGVAVEAGARLAFDRGDAIGDQPAHAGAAGGIERLLREQPGASRQGADAAALRLEVPALAALREHLEVHKAFLAIDDVGVGVDQARRHDLAGEIADGPGSPGGLRGGPDPGDPAIGDADRAVAHEAEGRIVGHRGDGCVGEQQVEHAIPHLSIAPASQPDQ